MPIFYSNYLIKLNLSHIASASDSLKVWDVTSGKYIKTLQNSNIPIFNILRLDGSRVLTITSNYFVNIGYRFWGKFEDLQ